MNSRKFVLNLKVLVIKFIDIPTWKDKILPKPP